MGVEFFSQTLMFQCLNLCNPMLKTFDILFCLQPGLANPNKFAVNQLFCCFCQNIETFHGKVGNFWGKNYNPIQYNENDFFI